MYIKLVCSGTISGTISHYYNFRCIEFYKKDGALLTGLSYLNVVSHTYRDRTDNAALNSWFGLGGWAPYTTTRTDNTAVVLLSVPGNCFSKIRVQAYDNAGGANKVAVSFSHNQVDFIPLGEVTFDAALQWKELTDLQSYFYSIQYLFKDGTDIVRFNSDTNLWEIVGTGTPDESMFINQGMDNLTAVNTLQTVVRLGMASQDLDDGKLWRGMVDKTAFNIQKIEVV